MSDARNTETRAKEAAMKKLTKRASSLLTRLHYHITIAGTRDDSCAPGEFRVGDRRADGGATRFVRYHNDDLRALLSAGWATVQGVNGVGIISITDAGHAAWLHN